VRLKELQAHWYDRLRDDGFDDIEVRGGDNASYRSITWASPKRGSFVDELQRESQAELYRRAGWFLHGFRFKSEEERVLWAMFADGVSYRDMSLRVGKSPSTICRALKKIIDGPFKDFVQARLSTDLYDYEEDTE
jgi:hypothetical protein